MNAQKLLPLFLLIGGLTVPTINYAVKCDTFPSNKAGGLVHLARQLQTRRTSLTYDEDFSTFEFALPRDPRIWRRTNLPEQLTFEELPEESVEQFRERLAGIWYVTYLCDGKPIPASVLANLPLNTGVGEEFTSFDFSERFRMIKSVGGRLNMFRNKRPYLGAIIPLQKPTDTPFVYRPQKIEGKNTFRLWEEWIIRPVRIVQNQDVVLEYVDESTAKYSKDVCGKENALRAYLIKDSHVGS